MISSRILNNICTIKEVSGHTYDAVGCLSGDTYGVTTSGISCYFTQISYETLPGKEPIKDVYRIYINTDKISAVDTSMKVFISNELYDILDTEVTYGGDHIEMILKKIGIA